MQARSGKTAGILVSDTDAWFVRRALAGLAPEFAALGWGWKAFELKGHSDIDYHRFIESVADDPSISGLVYGHMKLNLPQLARFRQHGLKVVGLTERFDGIDWITVDEVQGAYLATKHLLDLGHRQLALVNGPPTMIQCALREDGFRRALMARGLKPGRELDVRVLSMGLDEGREAANLLMDLAVRPTAIFVAAGDVTALGVLEALADRGFKVPQDVSVVGFDDLEVARLTTPPLTTVHQPLEAMGRWAARRLVAAVEAGAVHKPQGEILAAELIQRASCMPLAGVKAAAA
jgi:DNA-binding LacI/PurR family transcriptional regulator